MLHVKEHNLLSKSVETPTSGDHVEFRVSVKFLKFFLPTTFTRGLIHKSTKGLLSPATNGLLPRATDGLLPPATNALLLR